MRSLLLVLLAACSSGEGTLPGSDDAGTGDTLQNSDGAKDDGVMCGDRASTCGNGVCEDWESCRECARDCNACQVCALGISCANSAAPPTSHDAIQEFDNNNQIESIVGADLDDSIYAPSCLDHELRMRIVSIDVEKNGSGSKVDIFFAVTASDALRSELFVSPEWRGVSDGNKFSLNAAQETFGGQERDDADDNACKTFVPFCTNGNLSVAYQCFAAKNGGFSKVVQDVADASASAAGIPGVGGTTTGWVFAGVSIAGNLFASATSGTTEDELLSVTQTIDAKAYYEMTKGKRWTINREFSEGSIIKTRTNVKLVIESWGCAEAKPMIQ